MEVPVHCQPISDAEKLTHLQTLTTGRAHQDIAGYLSNNAMYTIWKTRHNCQELYQQITTNPQGFNVISAIVYRFFIFHLQSSGNF